MQIKFPVGLLPAPSQPGVQEEKHHVIGQIKARTERFKNSCYPNCLNEWDKLLPEVRQAPSLNKK